MRTSIGTGRLGAGLGLRASFASSSGAGGICLRWVAQCRGVRGADCLALVFVHACAGMVDGDGRVPRYLSDTITLVVHLLLPLDEGRRGCETEDVLPRCAATDHPPGYYGVYFRATPISANGAEGNA